MSEPSTIWNFESLWKLIEAEIRLIHAEVRRVEQKVDHNEKVAEVSAKVSESNLVLAIAATKETAEQLQAATDRRFDELSTKVDHIIAAQRQSEGRGLGMVQLIGWIFGGIIALGAFIEVMIKLRGS